MVYDFTEQLEIGQAHEYFLDSIFRRWFTICEASREQQRQGIDRIFTRNSSGDVTTVEYKTDIAASRTGNAFVETVSVDTNDKAGWAYTSQADWLFYYLPDDKLIYVYKFVVLREQLAHWKGKYRTKFAANNGYKTFGLLIPLTEFEKWSELVLSV